MKCPGQDTRYWKENAIYETRCPNCGVDIEFFKDDTTRKCRKCGHKFLNPSMDFGCASYCEHAVQCIGNLPPELLAQKEDMLKDRVAIEIKKYFGSDFKRIGHAVKVARYAEHIGKKEEGSNLAVILCTSYLHDIGINEAERKHRNTKTEFQKEEGLLIARSILEKLGAKESLVEEVCDIIGHNHNTLENETVNFKAVYDANLIVKIEEKQKDSTISTDRIKDIIKKSFLTVSGRDKAKEILLKKGKSDEGKTQNN